MSKFTFKLSEKQMAGVDSSSPSSKLASKHTFQLSEKQKTEVQIYFLQMTKDTFKLSEKQKSGANSS